MEDQTPQTKYGRNILKVMVIVISISLLTLVSGTSYAILNGTAVSSKEQIIRAGNVTLQLNEFFDNLNEGIIMMNDADGLLSDNTFDFTIKNVGTVGSEYALSIINEAPQGYSGQVLSINFFKIGLKINGKEYGPMSLEDVNGIIDNNSLAVNELNSYEMRIWLDESKEQQLEGKENYHAFLKLKVEAKQKTTIQEKYVYRWGTAPAYNYSPLAAGTYTGYCILRENNGNTFNLCATDNYGFLIQSACENQVNYIGGESYGVSCASGTWTTSGIVYTTNASTLNKDYYLRYKIGKQTEILESYVCYTLNNKEYCLKGADGVWNNTLGDFESPSFNDNKDILNKSFKSTNCYITNESTQTFYYCELGSLSVEVSSSGYLNISDGSEYCEVGPGGGSSCE